jgi:hypothetical protein
MILRDRPATEPDPYNPGRTRPAATWDDAATITLPDTPDAWIGTPSIQASGDPARSSTSSTASLFCDATVDVRQGDRLRYGGHTFIVQAVPLSTPNPWTGWQPPVEIPIQEVIDP